MTEPGTQVLSDLAGSSRAIVPEDDQRHPAPPADPYWGETTWWVFVDPDAQLAGWFYLLTRPNLGVAALGVWVWDHAALEPWRLPYSKSMVHLQLPADYDLRDLQLDGHGFRLRALDPLSTYAIEYDDTGIFAANLRFSATAPPQPMGVGDHTGHFDQPMWVSGEIRLGDRNATIDAPGFRDRTWSTRPETSIPRPNCYSWATARDRSFQLLSMLDEDGTPLHVGGYLFRDGAAAALTSIDRRVVDRGADARPARIEIDLVDALGRTSTCVGVCTSTAAIPGFAGYLTFASSVRWKIDGHETWGEDHDSWPHHVFRSRFA